MSITGCRNDALVKLLNTLGYQPVLLPRGGLLPPEVYVYRERDGQLIRRGKLSAYMPPGFVMPTLTTGTLFKQLSHQQTSGKSWKAAASFLGDALACIGITSAPKLDLSFVQGREVSFSFDDATYKAVDPADLDQILENIHTAAIPKQDVDEGNLHIAYDFAYAASISMRVAGDTTLSGTAKALEVEKFIDIGAEGKLHMTDQTTLNFASTDAEPAMFAYKVGRLERQDDRWEFHPEETAGENFLADEQGGQPYLMERGVVLRVEDD